MWWCLYLHICRIFCQWSIARREGCCSADRGPAGLGRPALVSRQRQCQRRLRRWAPAPGLRRRAVSTWSRLMSALAARGSHGGAVRAPAAVSRLRTTLSTDQPQQRSGERDNETRRVALAHRPIALLFIYLGISLTNSQIELNIRRSCGSVFVTWGEVCVWDSARRLSPVALWRLRGRS